MRAVPGEYILTAAGAGEDTRTIRIDSERPFLSSLNTLTRRRRQAPQSVERAVPVASLDALWRERAWKPPFGLKIDTEGFEHEVARGASEVLRQTEFVIAEVSVANRFHETPSFASFVSLMAESGFRLYDILDGQKGAVGGEGDLARPAVPGRPERLTKLREVHEDRLVGNLVELAESPRDVCLAHQLALRHSAVGRAASKLAAVLLLGLRGVVVDAQPGKGYSLCECVGRPRDLPVWSRLPAGPSEYMKK